MIYACGVPVITSRLCGWVFHWAISKQNHYLSGIIFIIIRGSLLLIESLYKLKIVSVDPLNSYRSFIGSSAITSCESAKLMQENLGEAKKSVQSLLWLRGEGAMSNLSNKTNYCFSRSPIIRQCNKRGHMIRIRGIHNILAPSFHWGPLNLIIDIFNKNMPIVQQSVGFNLNNRRRVLPQLRP